MDFSLFLFVLLGMLLLSLWLGSKFSGKLKDKEDYYLAGRELKFFPLMMTFVATQIGGGLVLGAAEEAYAYGWPVLLYPLGCALGFMLLASGVGRKMAEYPVSTVAQLFETIYRSSRLKQAASLLSILSLFMILAAQVIASKKFMISLGLDSTVIFTIFWSIIIIYTVLGGLRGVVSTDVFQATFFIGVLIVCLGYVVWTSDRAAPSLISAGDSPDSFDFSASKLCGWLLMPLLFMVIEQDMGQRCFAAKAPPVVSKAAMGAAFCTFSVSIIPIYLGISGKLAGVEAGQGGSILMAIIDSLTTPGIAAFAGCAVLAAILSTAVSLINAISSNISQDFDFGKLNRFGEVKISQLVTALIAVSGILFSCYFDNIVDLLIQSYELSVSCLFVPVFIGIFKKRGNKLSALLAIVFGVIGFIGLRVYTVEFPRELLSVLLSAAGYGIGEAFIPKPIENLEFGPSQSPGIRSSKNGPI